MIIWLIIAVVWLFAATLFYPFVKNHIEEEKCGANCSSCDDVTKCHVAVGLIAFIATPITPFLLLWKLALKPLSVLAGHYIGKLHTWEMSMVGSITDAAKEKKEEKKKKKEEKETETIKSLKKKNKELEKKVAELNSYGREEILDLEE